MGIRCGIVGLPNVGKSTLFNALTSAAVAAENYPFCTVEPNVGVAPVPDRRLERIAAIARPRRVTPATMEFVDIAGLVAGASRGEGLGNRFLARVRETRAIAHVVRCFESGDVAHVSGKVSPDDDIETIETELLLADLEQVEQARERAAKAARAGDRGARAREALMARACGHVGEGRPLRTLEIAPEEAPWLAALSPLTAKPVLYVANVAEDGFGGNPFAEAVEARARAEGAAAVRICAATEAELGRLDEAGRAEYFAATGLDESGLPCFVRAACGLLDLQTFFTAGPKEARAWTLRRGATALRAAGVVHGDIRRGFIRAEVIGYDDFVGLGGEQAAKAAGRWRLEGRDYVVAEGDVVHFRFSVQAGVPRPDGGRSRA